MSNIVSSGWTIVGIFQVDFLTPEPNCNIFTGFFKPSKIGPIISTPPTSFNKEILKENYPFSDLVDAQVNVLIFPNLTSGNIAYHLLKEVGGVDIIGPILLGLKKPVNILQLGSGVRNIINMATVAVVDAQLKTRIDTNTEVQRVSWWKRMKKRKK